MKHLHLLLIPIIALMLLGGCSNSIPAPSLHTKTTPEMIDQEANPEDLFEIVTGGPLYVLDTDSANPTLRKYRKLRAARIEEMVDLMDEEVELLDDTMEEMPEFREMLMAFLSKTAERLDEKNADHAKLKVFILDTIDRYVEAVTKSTVAWANLEALSKTLEDAEDKKNSAWAMLKYTEYALLNELIGAITHELTFFPGRTVGIVEVIRAKENKKKFDRKTRKLAKRFDSDVEDFLEDIQGPFQGVLSTHLDVGVGFESLEAADYAFMMAVMDFAETAVPSMEDSIKKIKTSELVTEDDKAFYQTFADFMKGYTDEMREGIEKSAEPEYLKGLTASNGIIPPFIEGTAHAGLSDWLGKTASALTQPLKDTGTAIAGTASGCVTSPWQCTKKAFKNTQKGIGMAVDSVNLAVGTSMDVAANVYYGNSLKDTQKQVYDTVMTTYKAWDEGKPGATVLRTAKDYVDGFEKGVGSVAGGVVNKAIGAVEWGLDKTTGGRIKNVYGKETATWAANKLGEITTNMMTGAGKGLLALSNPDSSNAELVEGAIDVAFAFTGGSKSVVKGGQALKGTKNVSKELAKKGSKQLQKLAVKLESKALKGSTNKILAEAQKKLTKAEINMIYSNTKQLVANEAKEKLLKETEKSFGKILGEGLEQGGKTVWGNIKKEVPEAFANFTTKSYQKSLAGLKEMAGDVFGKNLGEWGNNVFGNLVDTQFKNHFIPLVAPKDKAVIDKQEKGGAAIAGLADNDAAQGAIGQMMQNIAKASAQLALVEKAANDAADEIAEKAAQAAVEEKLLEKVADEVEEKEKELSKPVVASGNFAGDYSGGVTLRFAPIGGPVSGSVSTEYGSARIRGSIKDGKLSARVTGTLSYDWYADGGTKTKKTCTLSARMSGSVGERSASGSYGGSCAKEGDSGSWRVSW